MNTKILAVIVILVLLGGGGYLLMKKGGNPGGSSTATLSDTENVFSSIKDALSKSLTLECTFNDDQGRQTKAYIKNGAVRSDFTGANANESGSVIVKDKKIYFWNAQGGFMMTEPEVTPGASQPAATGNEQTPGNAGNVMATLEKYKNDCKPSVVTDSLFTPPSNINFQDFSKMMQQVPAAPTGVTVPTINYQQYMPQGQNPPQAPSY